MSKTLSPVRFGPPTTATLQSDMTAEWRILSARCADVEGSVRRIARLATEPGATAPVVGWHGARVYPERIDHAALAGIRDEVLRDAQRRLGELQGLLASLIETP